MSKTYLKIKIKSLAEEAKIIRQEERKEKMSYKDIKLRNLLNEKGAVVDTLIDSKWSVAEVTNDTVVLERLVSIPGSGGKTRSVFKKINLNWTPTQENFNRHVNTFWGLRNHRTGVVRQETRESLLAYAFIRGQSYRTAEAMGDPIAKFRWNYDQKVSLPVFNFDLTNIARLATKYGETEVTRDDIEKWVLRDEYGVTLEAAE
jgi:hypothetical protein